MGNCFSGAEPSPGSKRFSTASFASFASSSRASQQPPFEDFLVLKDQSPPPPPLTDLFALGRVLGRGAFGVTRLARERATGQAVAVKTIARRRIAAHLPDHAERVQCEVEAMWRVSGHPHIVALKSCHEDEKGVHLAMELCSGGELFEQVSKRGAYTEACAAQLVRELVRIVAHCHDRGVVHRDLKPENLLLASPEPGAALKAIDFGLAALVEPSADPAGAAAAAACCGGDKAKNDGASPASSSLSSSSSPCPALASKEPLTELCGSPLYIAPEVLRRSYGKGADMWSVGVIAHVLLTGRAPFDGQTERQVFDQILKKKLDLRSEQTEPWPQISPGGKDFVQRLLERDPRRRLTARQALAHPWLSEDGGGDDSAMSKCTKQLDVLKTMCDFAQTGAARRRAAAVVAERAPPELIEALLPAFRRVDAGDARDGTVALGVLPALLGAVDAGTAAAALKGRGGGGLLDAAAASAAVGAAGEAAADRILAAAACACPAAKKEEEAAAAPATAAAAATPASSPSAPPPSPTAKAVEAVFQEVMGKRDPDKCGCRVDYAAFLKAAADEARALREESLSAALAKLDPKKSGELPRGAVEAATRRVCRAIPQHVIDAAVAAAAEAAAGASCAARRLARKKKQALAAGGGKEGAAAGGGGVAETASLNEKVKGVEAEENAEEMVDYELFCAELARVCPSCPTSAAKAA